MTDVAKDELEAELIGTIAWAIWGFGSSTDGAAKAVLAHIRAIGLAVVPQKPTKEMQDAMVNAMADLEYVAANEHEAVKIYQAAIKAAAPEVKP